MHGKHSRNNDGIEPRSEVSRASSKGIVRRADKPSKIASVNFSQFFRKSRALLTSSVKRKEEAWEIKTGLEEASAVTRR